MGYAVNGDDVTLLAEAMVLGIGGYLGGTWLLNLWRGWRRRRRMVAWRPERPAVRVVGPVCHDWQREGWA